MWRRWGNSSMRSMRRFPAIATNGPPDGPTWSPRCRRIFDDHKWANCDKIASFDPRIDDDDDDDDEYCHYFGVWLVLDLFSCCFNTGSFHKQPLWQNCRSLVFRHTAVMQWHACLSWKKLCGSSSCATTRCTFCMAFSMVDQKMVHGSCQALRKEALFIGKMLVPLGWYPSCLTPQGAHYIRCI